MKIAIIRREYITHIDGVNRFIATLGEALVKLGHDVTLFSWSYRNVDEDLSAWFSEVHNIDVKLDIRILRGPVPQSWFKIALDWFIKGSKILKDYDAAIINGIVPLRFKPTIAVLHDIKTQNGISNRLYTYVATSLYNRVDAVVCISSKTAKDASELGVKCTEIIPPPIKLDMFAPSKERENIIVHIGGRGNKNIHISSKAIELLNKRGLRYKLYIIGADGPSNDIIKYMGFVKEAREIIKLLCKAKALIHPSSHEGFGLAVAEAMACGTPVVVSEAVPEDLVINGYNGLRVSSFSYEDYANALERLLTNEELWNSLSRNGLEYVKRFSHIEVAKRYIDLIRKINEDEQF